MVKRPRFSLAALMVVVAVVGAEVALLRAVVDTATHWEFGEASAISSPMAIVLAYALFALWRRAASPFWRGFAAVGAVSTVLLFVGVWSDNRLVEAYERYVAGPLMDPVLDAAGRGQHGVLFWCAYIPLVLSLFSLPPAVAAIVGGWFSTRYRIAIVRRQPVTPVPSGAEAAEPQVGPDIATRGALLS